jgi:hypothetical protein
METKTENVTKEHNNTFNEIMSRMSVPKKLIRKPESKFYMIDGVIFLEHDLRYNDFYIRFDGFWGVFVSKFNLNPSEMRDLMRYILKHYFNCDVRTCGYASQDYLYYWNNLTDIPTEHYHYYWKNYTDTL